MKLTIERGFDPYSGDYFDVVRWYFGFLPFPICKRYTRKEAMRAKKAYLRMKGG